MNHRWFLRAVRWVRNPPSPRKVKFYLGFIAILICVALVEHYIGWPDFLQMDRPPRIRRF